MTMGPELLPVREHGCERPFNKWEMLANGCVVISGITTNTLIPLTRARPDIMMPWLIANDLIGLVFIGAGITTKTVDPSVPAIRKKLASTLDSVKVNVKMGHVFEGRCYTCEVDVPQRTKHCEICRKCVEEFDHHCVFLNTCIGKENHGSFLTTLTSGIIYLVSSMIMNASAVILEYIFDADPASLPIWLFAALNVLASMCMIVPLAFLIKIFSWQIRAILQGLTQYEWFKKMSKAKRAEEGEEIDEQGDVVVEEDDDIWSDELVEVKVELEEEKKNTITIDYSWLLRKPLES